ncbi:glycosyltransferase family 32 protein [Leuconostoc mesenteroides]|uniref:glycosyltransferase family 32 protein n=1 Tax=Leuconostoc mesenteroides TaxID=1245 RepID=UPI003CED4816
MIPKIIHYAWVGEKIPKEVESRVNDWKKIMPDWKFMFWNENNWNFDSDEFSKKQITEKKYGFAIDVLRYDVVYQYGGFYLDTDMIVKQPLDLFIDQHNVFGLFYKNSITTSFFGAEKNSPIIRELYEVYTNKNFMPNLYKAAFEGYTSNPIVTNYFMNTSPEFKQKNEKQLLRNGQITLYSKETFTYQSFQKNKTFTIHLLENSWNKKNTLMPILRKYFIKFFGMALWGKISAYRGAKREEYRLLNVKFK